MLAHLFIHLSMSFSFFLIFLPPFPRVCVSLKCFFLALLGDLSTHPFFFLAFLHFYEMLLSMRVSFQIQLDNAGYIVCFLNIVKKRHVMKLEIQFNASLLGL